MLHIFTKIDEMRGTEFHVAVIVSCLSKKVVIWSRSIQPRLFPGFTTILRYTKIDKWTLNTPVTTIRPRVGTSPVRVAQIVGTIIPLVVNC
jgi:hypothetical protein